MSLICANTLRNEGNERLQNLPDYLHVFKFTSVNHWPLSFYPRSPANTSWSLRIQILVYNLNKHKHTQAKKRGSSCSSNLTVPYNPRQHYACINQSIMGIVVPKRKENKTTASDTTKVTHCVCDSLPRLHTWSMWRFWSVRTLRRPAFRSGFQRTESGARALWRTCQTVA